MGFSDSPATLLTSLDSQMRFFNMGQSVANQMSPSFSTNHMSAAPPPLPTRLPALELRILRGRQPQVRSQQTMASGNDGAPASSVKPSLCFSVLRRRRNSVLEHSKF
ncbi:hypothetical protein EYF80_011069 [Liparis tanakae]|uniref:Uncharacterized protein n=1 Tax=Liparis tanakae TaxID=230148 RepID=A0A4Z2ILE8_9TELE|nr:hypothetical protein EYF80_011069 [Liparis tanakae]